MKKIDINNNHYPWLDAFRFAAAFMVLICHSRHDMFVDYGLLPDCDKGLLTQVFYLLTRLGNEAVVIFFVISGFLVGGRGIERILVSDFKVKDYAVDRTVRIGIPLCTSILFCIFVYILLDMEFSYLTAIGNLFSLQGILVNNLISPFWSLSYEVWFYILLLAFALSVKKHFSGLILMLITCLVFLKLSPEYLLIWLLGAFAYLCRPQKYSRCVLIVSAILMVSFAVLSNMAAESDSVKMPLVLNRSVFRLLMSLAVAVFIQQIILCVPQTTVSKRINKWGGYLADFSYTLYLSHRITLLLVFKFLFEKDKGTMCLNDIIAYILILVMCISVSYTIYFFTERHTNKAKHFIKSQLY